jgi:hypothetical protein
MKQSRSIKVFSLLLAVRPFFNLDCFVPRNDDGEEISSSQITAHRNGGRRSASLPAIMARDNTLALTGMFRLGATLAFAKQKVSFILRFVCQ